MLDEAIDYLNLKSLQVQLQEMQCRQQKVQCMDARCTLQHRDVRQTHTASWGESAHVARNPRAAHKKVVKVHAQHARSQRCRWHARSQVQEVQHAKNAGAARRDT